MEGNIGRFRHPAKRRNIDVHFSVEIVFPILYIKRNNIGRTS